MIKVNYTGLRVGVRVSVGVLWYGGGLQLGGAQRCMAGSILHRGYGVATRPRAHWMLLTAGMATLWPSSSSRISWWSSAMFVACASLHATFIS